MKRSKTDAQVRDERVMEAYSDYQQGRITRRDFFRYASTMGASLAALGLNACAQPTPQVVEKTVEKTVKETVEVVKQVEKQVEVTKMVEKVVTPTPIPTPPGGIVRGGRLISTMAYSTERFNDPALAANTFVANTYRQVCDWLVRVAPDLTLKPALATKWTPSADGKDWTIELRKGVKFNHGKDFTADDVVFTFNRLLDPSVKSAYKSVANYLKQGSIEKKDDYTVIFHCDRVVGDFPYHLHDYHAPILPADWGGDFYKQPYGTGPFTITEWRPDEHILFKRRDNYWDMGVDGKPLPYVDEVEVLGYPDDPALLDALSKGQLHLSYVAVASMPQVLQMRNLLVTPFQTSNFHNAVLHCNEKPFSDVRVRQALKLAMDRPKFIKSVMFGYGIEAPDHPVGPIYADAPDILAPKRDIEKAKALLTEAGFPNGLDIKMSFYADDMHTNLGQWIQASGKDAGFRLTLAPNPDYFQVWLNDWGANVMGGDNWASRATPSEYFNIAYKTGGDWNETHWSNKDLDNTLVQYDAELDPVKRKAELKQMCQILADDGGMINSGWRQDIYCQDSTVQNFVMHPLVAMYYRDVWLAPKA
jgi:peptide/nickel transport system substrate-binding protein